MERECLKADAEVFNGDDDDVFTEGYTMDMKLIVYAWARFRPVPDAAEEGKATKKKRKIEQVQNLKDIFDEPFINRLMANTHLKIYNFNDSEM